MDITKGENMDNYNNLENSGRSLGAMGLLVMILLWGGAVAAFFFLRNPLTTCIWLFVAGIIINLICDAVSKIMIAMADNMRDDHVTRECMEKLIARAERIQK